MSWAAMKPASLTSAGCAGRFDITQPSGRFHRGTLLCPRVTLPGSASSVSVRCRFRTCRPVYRGFCKMVVTVPSGHPAPVRCLLRRGSAADGHGTPASFSALAIRATECRQPGAGRRSTAPHPRPPGRAPAGTRAAPTRRAPCSGAAPRPQAGTRTEACRLGTGPAMPVLPSSGRRRSSYALKDLGWQNGQRGGAVWRGEIVEELGWLFWLAKGDGFNASPASGGGGLYG